MNPKPKGMSRFPPAKWIRAAGGLLGLTITLALPPAGATFICDPPSKDEDEKFTVACGWNQKVAPLQTQALSAKWPLKLREVADFQGRPKLLIDLQHAVAPHAATDAPNSPNPPEVFDAGSFPPGAEGKGLRVLTHTPAKGVALKDAHFDIYRYEVFNQANNPNVPPVIVVLNGDHEEKKGTYRWSYSNIGPVGGVAKPGKLTVTELQVGQEKRIEDKRPLQPKQRVEGDLSDKARGVRIQFILGDPVTTESMLGFIEGPPGQLSFTDLALLAGFFEGNGQFFIPMLFDKEEVQDLFVAVDLAQWLPADLHPVPGDEYVLQSGKHPLLPGFFVSTTAIQLDPTLGFSSANPVHNFRVFVGGLMDGQVVKVSSPATLALLLAGLGVLAAQAAWTRRRRTGVC